MKWVTMWGNAQSIISPLPSKYAKDVTFRYPLFTPFNGDKIKVTFDNFVINGEIKVDKASISLGDKLSDEQSEVKYLSFNGESGFVLGSHESITSDEIDFKVKENKYLIISFYIKEISDISSAVLVTGPLSTGYFAFGDQVSNKTLDLETRVKTNWIHLISNVDIYTDDKNESLICYGDSITAQDWPDDLLLLLRENNINNVSVIRKAVCGTRILREYSCVNYQSYGLKGKKRFTHECSSVLGAKKIIIQHGINDIIHPVGEEVNIYRPMSDLPTVDDLIEGIEYYLKEAKSLNLDSYVGTLLPIYNWRTYAEFREVLKNNFNTEIKRRYQCIDFEKAIADYLENYSKFKDGFDSGDHLHPSKIAYKEMAKCAFERLFKEVK